MLPSANEAGTGELRQGLQGVWHNAVIAGLGTRMPFTRN